MDVLTVTEVWMSLLTLCLHLVSGFYISEHKSDVPSARLKRGSVDEEQAKEAADSLQLVESLYNHWSGILDELKLLENWSSQSRNPSSNALLSRYPLSPSPPKNTDDDDDDDGDGKRMMSGQSRDGFLGPIKRQQFFHTAYGKRYHQAWETDFGKRSGHAMSGKRPIRRSSYDSRQEMTPGYPLTSEWLIAPESGKNDDYEKDFETDDNDDIMYEAKRDAVIPPFSVGIAFPDDVNQPRFNLRSVVKHKRHQGWFTDFGKRNSNNDRPLFS